MTTLTLQFSEQPVVTLPAELARRAGLMEGQVRVIFGEQGLTVMPTAPPTDYAVRWQTMAIDLREQASQFGLSLEDRRDAEYWEIVDPLYEETEHIISSARY